MKLWKKILIVIFIVVLAVCAAGGFLVSRILYPEAMISGDGDKKVICVGDSLTFGQGVLTSRKTDSYPAVLAELLGDGYQVVNYGLPNRTLLSTGNMPYCEEGFYGESLAQDAEIVIIMLGTNDSKPDNWNAERFEAEYAAFIRGYQAMDSQPEVYVMVPPAIFLENPDSGDCSEEILTGEIIEIISRISQNTGAGLIDLYSVTEHHSEWYGDGLHLNAEGNRAAARAIYEAVMGE